MSWILPMAALLPMIAAPVAYLAGRGEKRRGIAVMTAVSLLCLAAVLYLTVRAASGETLAFAMQGVCGQGFSLRADGFRGMYATIAALMWLCTSIFSFDYFSHEENVPRYCFFTLLTLGGTIGVLLSDTLYTTFLFFEVMSLASYPWVAQEETPDAMRAAETYLYIAIIGGLCMLMGLLLLPSGLATLPFEELSGAAATLESGALRWPTALLLVGFGAKAGAFPLHIWLPKAHPVAPSPASALLSGMLTKTGVFGILVLGCKLWLDNAVFGELIFWIGVITMLLGAVLALFSINLKRTLACSSLSQIGFILLGIGLCGLLGRQNGLAAWGTVLHMLNHSIFKLLLFTCAGVVLMNAHTLDLTELRGFGRRKPLLHIAFLSGLLGIGGFPLFSGYISKSLLHEGLLEYIGILGAQGVNATAYSIAEWLFLLAGGMTVAYMLKLYVCLFWQKNPTRQAEYNAQRRYVTKPTAAVLLFCAAIPPVLGCLPSLTMSGLARLSESFLQTQCLQTIHYFAVSNLVGACKSLVIGAALYALVVRTWLMRRTPDHYHEYPDRWPSSLDLENAVYRPLLALMAAAGQSVALVLDHLTDWLVMGLSTLGSLLARLMEKPVDACAALLRKTVFSGKEKQPTEPVGTRFTDFAGEACDNAATVLNHTIRRRQPVETDFVPRFAALREVFQQQGQHVTRSISFSLLMFCMGLFVTLLYLILA